MNEQPVTVIRRQIQGKPQYRGETMVEVDLAYPRVITKGSPAGQVISVFYDHVARRFYAYASRSMFADAVKARHEAKKNGYPFNPYGANMVYEVPFNQNGLLSIFYDQYTYTGGGPIPGGSPMRAACRCPLSLRTRGIGQSFFSPFWHRCSRTPTHILKNIRKMCSNTLTKSNTI